MTASPEMVLAFPLIMAVIDELEEANKREINSLLSSKDENFEAFIRLKAEKQVLVRVRARFKAACTPPKG